MRGVLTAAGVLLTSLAVLAGGSQQTFPTGVAAPAVAPPVAAAAGPYRAILNTYCAGCHNNRASTAATESGVILDTDDLSDVFGRAQLWERVLRKLKTRTMPPVGARRPDEDTYHALTAWLEQQIDQTAVVRPHPGRPVLRRLNRTEYG